MTFVPVSAAFLAILQAAPGGQLTGMLFMYGAIFAIFYFIIIRPQQKQKKDHESLVKALKKGDEIVTSGGVVGEVVSIQSKDAPALDDRITIKSGDSRLIIERGRIARVGNGPTVAG
jgi:preprotein translocase subunit YajC